MMFPRKPNVSKLEIVLMTAVVAVTVAYVFFG